jgi:beta-barrel assembly-enhancing protease
MKRLRGFRLTALVSATFLWAVVAQAQTAVHPGFNVFSVAQDTQIGAQSAAQVDRQVPLLSESSVTRYVSSLGARLAAQAPGHRFPYRFRVANLSDVNAFALPGGPIYIHRGLIENVRTEGELAGVIAHEIAHVALRHQTNQASKAYLAQAGIGLLGGLLGGSNSSSSTSQIINTIGGFGLNSLFLKFSRSMESQADVVGAQIMARAGYDPNEMASFFSRMQRMPGGNPGKVAVFLSNHPAPADREARVRREANLIGAVRSGPTQGSIASVQSQLRGMSAAPTLAQVASGGATTTRGAVGSSATRSPTAYRLYRHRSGLFQLEQPDHWTAYASSGYGVTFAPPGGIVSARGRQGIAAGMIVNHYVPFEGSIGAGYGGSLPAATSDLAQQLMQGSPYLRRVSGSDRRLTVSGHPSFSTVLRGTPPSGSAEERITVVTSQLHDDHVIYMLLVAPSDSYASLEPAFHRMLKSMRIGESARHD